MCYIAIKRNTISCFSFLSFLIPLFDHKIAQFKLRVHELPMRVNEIDACIPNQWFLIN